MSVSGIIILKWDPFSLVGKPAGTCLYDVLSASGGEMGFAVSVYLSVFMTHVQFWFQSFTPVNIIWHGPWNSPFPHLHANSLFDREQKKKNGQSEQTDKELCNRKEGLKCVGLPAVFALFCTTSDKSLFLDFALTVVQHT